MNCIVVPIYKKFENITSNELISLTQLFKVMGSHPIFFFAAEGFEYHPYLRFAENKGVKNIGLRFFDKIFFSGIEGYNRLLTSYEFYYTFREYNYMLIYQLDAYVFKDELSYWCEKGYDYIGAPWFKYGFTSIKSNEILTGGNGGFSLRNVKKHIQILERIRKAGFIKRNIFLCTGFINAATKINPFTGGLFIKFFFKNINTMGEDVFWCFKVGYFYKDFKIAPFEDSLKFSFEIRPAYLFEKNNNKLPFGCHAWLKFGPHFWEKYIPINENLDNLK